MTGIKVIEIEGCVVVTGELLDVLAIAECQVTIAKLESYVRVYVTLEP